MIDRSHFLDQPIRKNIKHENIKKTSTGQTYDYTTGCLLD